MAPEQGHLHGGDPTQVFERLGLSATPVVDFSVNVSPLGVPGRVKEQWGEWVPELTRYPSITGKGVCRFYQERFDLPAEAVLPGNGSIELIYLVPRVLGLKRVVVVTPCFNDYSRASQLARAEVVSLPFSVENRFAPLSISALEEALHLADALFLGSPNNPTGTVFPPEDLQQLAAAFPDKWILVDEAFIQFLEQYQETTLMAESRLAPNILVFNSLTKFYALAGIRLGALVSHPDTVSKINRYKEPWTVNRIGEKVAAALIECREYEERLRRLIQEERYRIFKHIQPLSGLRLFPASANFFLAQWTATDNLDDLIRPLLAKGLYVRDCRNFPGLEQNFFRFAVLLPADNDRLISLLSICAR